MRKILFLLLIMLSVFSCQQQEETGFLSFTLSDSDARRFGSISIVGTPAPLGNTGFRLKVSPVSSSAGPGFSRIGASEKNGVENESDIELGCTDVVLSYGKWNFDLIVYKDGNLNDRIGVVSSEITVSSNGITGENVSFNSNTGILVCSVNVSSGDVCYFDADASLGNIVLKCGNVENPAGWTKEFRLDPDDETTVISGRRELAPGSSFFFYLCAINGDLLKCQALEIPDVSNGNVYSVPSGCVFSFSGMPPTLSEIYVPPFIHDGGKVSFRLDSAAKKSDIWFVFANATDDFLPPPAVVRAEDDLYASHASMLFRDVSHLDAAEPVKINVDPNPPLILSQTPRHRDVNANMELVVDKPVKNADSKGGTSYFYVEGWSDSVPATCMEYRAGIDTANGKRNLAIYVQDNMTSSCNKPTETEIGIVADAFLQSGLNNDIYDKLTAMYGNDIGYFNTHSSNPCKDSWDDDLISDVETITILFCDIDKQGDLSGRSSYIGGYFGSSDYFVNGKVNVRYSDGSVHPLDDSNERAMVFLHSHKACGNSIGEGLTTLSHEFQHLIHAQHFNGNFPGRISGKTEDSTSTNEMFSSMAESYTAQFIHKKTGKTVPGPFHVGDNGNESGYVTSGTAGSWPYNGRGPFALYALANSIPFKWWGYCHEDMFGNYIKYDSLIDYGKVAALGYYILVNYGVDVVKKYMESGEPDLDGIVAAINEVNGAGYVADKTDFLSLYGASCLLSSVNNMPLPYSFSRLEDGSGWFEVNGMKVPSVNLWLYRNCESDIAGFENSNGIQYDTAYPSNMSDINSLIAYFSFSSYCNEFKGKYSSETVNFVKVKSDVMPGSSVQVDLGDIGGLGLKVVAVPQK